MTDLHTENARLREALEAAKRDTALALAQVDRLLTLTTTLATERDDSRKYAVALEAELKARTLIATPTPDAVQEAARVPEIAALIEAAKAIDDNYTGDCGCDECNAKREALDAAIRAIAGDRT